MQNAKLVKHHRHSEGVKRLWESPLLLLRKKREIATACTKPRNDGLLSITLQINISNHYLHKHPRNLLELQLLLHCECIQKLQILI